MPVRKWHLIPAIYSGILMAAWPVYKPGSIYFPEGFTSDLAIPVLMANHSSPDFLFDLFYWGQDRLGTWPFLIFRLFAGSTLPEHIAFALYLLTHIAFFIFSVSFARKPADSLLLLLSMTAPVHCVSEFGVLFFNFAQPYGWQVSTLLIAISLMRSRRPYLFSLSILFAFLSIWMNPVSFAILLIYNLIEYNQSIQRFVWKSLPAGSGFLLYQTIKNLYLEQYEYYRTPIDIFFAQIVKLSEDAFLKHLTGIEMALWLFAILLLIYFLLERVKGFESRFKSIRSLSIAFILSAVILFCITSAVKWVLMNHSGVRYFLIPRYLLMAGLTIGSYTFIQRRHYILPVLILFCLSVAIHPVSKSGDYHEAFIEKKKIANIIQKKYPEIPLVGNYWHTYVYASLQNHNQPINRPIPGMGQLPRTPFWRLGHAPFILVNTENYKHGLQKRIRFGENIYEFKRQIEIADWFLFRRVE